VHGSYFKLTIDVYRIVRALVGEKPWTLAIMPLAALVPIATAGHWFNEIRFCRKWSQILQREEKQPRMLWQLTPSVAQGD
jgi:hypothetical protein